MNLARTLAVSTVAASAFMAFGAQADTLSDVQKKRYVQCGVDGQLPGFSAPDSRGQMAGIDVDVCRAVAAATIGRAAAVRYTPLTAKERFTALSSGEVDVLSRNTTWTLTRDSSLGLNFAGVNYYDGQGFLVSKNLGVSSALELDGADICIQAGTTTELNLADFFRVNNMKYRAITYDTSVQTKEGFEAGRCDVLTSDQSQLAAIRIQLATPASAVVLPDVISKEPLGPVVRQGDDKWFNIVKWSMNCMINAEEYGVSSSNIRQMRQSTDANVRRMLGLEGQGGQDLGISNRWCYNIVAQVGNYKEIYDRNVGPDSRLALPRGVNALWKDGGILYAPPIR